MFARCARARGHQRDRGCSAAELTRQNRATWTPDCIDLYLSLITIPLTIASVWSVACWLFNAITSGLRRGIQGQQILEASFCQAGGFLHPPVTRVSGTVGHDRSRSERPVSAIRGRARVPDQVIGDEGKISHILNNLLSNAVKFTDAGEVRLKLQVIDKTRDACMLRFSVSDTGIGIPSER